MRAILVVFDRNVNFSAACSTLIITVGIAIL